MSEVEARFMVTGIGALPITRQKIFFPPRYSPPVDSIVSAVAGLTDISREEILGRQRSADIAFARQMVMYAARQRGWSYERIGRKLDRDHTTIIHGVRRIEREVSRNASFARQMARLVEDIR